MSEQQSSETAKTQNKILVEHRCITFYPNQCHGPLGIFDSRDDAIEWFRRNRPYTFKCGRMIKDIDELFLIQVGSYLEMYPLPYNSCK